MFQTNVPAHCWVEYGTDSMNVQRARTLADGQEVCYDIENKIVLGNLKPGTKYFYRVCAVDILMKHFFADTQKRVGAVAGNVKVGNECNMLTRWQAIEYSTSQNFDRMAYSAINAITVVPGAIGAFRKEAVMKAGGLQTDTLAEDCDLTIRILRP